MKKHTKLYIDEIYDGDLNAFMCCELCYFGGLGHVRAVDIHHISARGMGGSRLKDFIENLVGSCRACHNDCENGAYTKEEQYKLHELFLIEKQIVYDESKLILLTRGDRRATVSDKDQAYCS